MKEKVVPYTWEEVLSSFRTRLGKKLLSLLKEDWYSVRELSNLVKTKNKEKKIQTNPHVTKLIKMWKEIGILDEKVVLKYFERKRNGKKHLYPSKKPRVRLNLAKFFSLYFRFFLRYSIPVEQFSDKEIITNYGNILTAKYWAGHLISGLEKGEEGWKIFFPIKGNFVIERWFEVLFGEEDVKRYIFELEGKNLLTPPSPVKILEEMDVTLSELERLVLKFFKQIYIVYDYFNVSNLLPKWIEKIEKKYEEKSLKVLTYQEIKNLWKKYYTELFEEYLKREWERIIEMTRKNMISKTEISEEKRKEWEKERKELDLPWIKLFTWIRLLPLGNELCDMFSGEIEDVLGFDSFSLLILRYFK